MKIEHVVEGLHQWNIEHFAEIVSANVNVLRDSSIKEHDQFFGVKFSCSRASCFNKSLDLVITQGKPVFNHDVFEWDSRNCRFLGAV